MQSFVYLFFSCNFSIFVASFMFWCSWKVTDNKYKLHINCFAWFKVYLHEEILEVMLRRTVLNKTLGWIEWNVKSDDSRSEPELDKVWRLGYGWALAVHVSLKFMWWYTQKPELSFWSDHNRTMNYLSEFAKKKQNSVNINLAIISSLWLGIKMSLFWFTAITSHL